MKIAAVLFLQELSRVTAKMGSLGKEAEWKHLLVEILALLAAGARCLALRQALTK